MVIEKDVTTEDLYSLSPKALWQQFRSEGFSFWMICGYLFIEYVRPQSIVPALNFLPWGQIFLLFALAGWGLSNPKWVASSANKWMIAFLAIITMSCFAALYPEYSWKHYKDFYSWVIIYFAIINVVTTPKRLFIFLLLFLLCSFKISQFTARVWAARGFAFTGWGLQGPPGFFENSGELAIQMLIFFPLSFGMAVFLKKYIGKVKYYFLLTFPLTAVATILGASTRGAQLALIYQLYRAFLKGKLSAGRIVIVLCVGAAVYFAIPQEQKDRFASAGEDKTSQQRLLYWKHGAEMIKENPVLGVGFFNFIPYYESHFPNDMLYPFAELPHNIFVQVGTDSGLLGLSVFLMLIYQQFAILRSVRKNADQYQRGAYYLAMSEGISAGLWGFLIAGQFVTVTYYPFFWIGLAFAVALKNTMEKDTRIAAKS